MSFHSQQFHMLAPLTYRVQQIGVARFLIGGAPNHKSHAMMSSKIFKRNFCEAKILYNGRSETVAWFGT